VKTPYTIGTSTIPGGVLIPKIMPRILRRNPNFSLRLEISNSRETFEKVLRGDVEIGIIGTQYETPSIQYRPIIRGDRLVLIASRDHPLAKRSQVSLDDLKGQPFIQREEGSGTRKAYEEAFDQAGFSVDRMDVVAEVGSTDGIIQAVEAGTGLAVVSEVAVQEAVRCGDAVVLSLPFEIHRNFTLITRKDGELSPLGKEVVSLLEAVISEG